jgi:hypothetical protein
LVTVAFHPLKIRKMKRNLIYVLSALFSLMLIISACTPEEFELGEPISKSELNYTITQDPTDPNMVILESLTPGLTPNWTTPMGRSNRVKDTVKLAFAGEYKFVYGVLSDGGFVQDDTVKLTITTTNLSYVDDPMWTMLTGGVDEEKTWLLDLDADGGSKFFNGPLYFAGLSYGYGNECIDDVDCWSWNPDWAGNSWLMPAGDYGTMTFSLKGNALIHADHKMLGRVENGTYFLDAKGKKLSMTDASPLHDAGRDGQVVNWGDLQIISMTENTMQLAALRDQALSGEGPVWLIYNYISKSYSDNWAPVIYEGDPEINVDLGNGTAQDLIAVTTTKTWSLSPDSPFDWATLEGELMNGWQTVGDYPGWAAYTVADQADVAKNKIIFSANGDVKTIDSDGVEAEGTHSVEEGTNIISFEGIVPYFKMGGWAVATTTAENQWKIVKTKKTGSTVTDIWFGRRDPDKPEYMVYHFVLGSSDVDPVEENRKKIIAALTGPTGTRSFRVSDTWHVDWLAGDLTGGWTSPTTFADDFASNSWVWTEAVKQGLQEPRLTFTNDGGQITVTKLQDGVTTSASVVIDAASNTLTIEMDLIAFEDAASWLPTYGPVWYICKTDLSVIETEGMWLGDLGVSGGGSPEVTAIHYIIAD